MTDIPIEYCRHQRFSLDAKEQIGVCLDCGAEGRMRFVVPSTAVGAKEKAACYGVMCELHKTCARYYAVEESKNESQVVIGTCGKDRILYEKTNAK